ncbi:LacI family DNA-binding transcriptional regulator [Jiella sp. MQZ9-1]|uniref:LacI family DNA-binding transcriptional regulator n=1 Tax=Jiella flava TaxID=2816857 RepID=A0A939JWK1_9HYPH|nr:LacI family DNA-binding transcriptional regulator [Jiella flava]MBO0663127.1 LacI family DNA-binding transcriptional regulator [Jiella flava]MCD2471546.1 LacI family DNA-binding transcriptional regulator [Jiella flava]
MSDVAAEAGVSPSTVSLFLRRPTAVSAKTGAAIARVIERLGYVPNLMAGGLAAARSRVVGVIVPSMRNAFFAQTVSSLQTLLAQHGFQVMIASADYDDQSELALVQAYLSWSPSALVLTGFHHAVMTRDLLHSAACPVVEMWEHGDHPLDLSVGFSHIEAGRAAARHLVRRGRRQLAFLGARMQEDRRAMQRARGFAEEVAQAGGTVEIVNHPRPASAETAAGLVGMALAKRPGIEGVATSNDTLGLGVLFECARRGIDVPGDLAIIGFGDLEFSGFTNPSLSTIRPFGDVIGEEIARLLLACFETGERPANRAVDTGFVVVERGSS